MASQHVRASVLTRLGLALVVLGALQGCANLEAVREFGKTAAEVSSYGDAGKAYQESARTIEPYLAGVPVQGNRADARQAQVAAANAVQASLAGYFAYLGETGRRRFLQPGRGNRRPCERRAVVARWERRPRRCNKCNRPCQDAAEVRIGACSGFRREGACDRRRPSGHALAYALGSRCNQLAWRVGERLAHRHQHYLRPCCGERHSATREHVGPGPTAAATIPTTEELWLQAWLSSRLALIPQESTGRLRGHANTECEQGLCFREYSAA